MRLAADAAGALTAGLLLESSGGLFRPRAPSAVLLAMGWAAALVGFAFTRTYPIALALLFLAGFFELSFSSMTQTLVQMNAPDASRGRVLGLNNMGGLGAPQLQRVTVGIAGSVVSIHVSLAVSATFFVLAMGTLFLRRGGLRPG